MASLSFVPPLSSLPPETPTCDDVLRLLLSTGHAGGLVLDADWIEPDPDELVETLTALGGRGWLALDRLVLDHEEARKPGWGDLSPLLEAFEGLAALVVTAGARTRLGRGGHASLRRLELIQRAAAPELLRDLLRSSWPALERLHLRAEGRADLDDLLGLISGGQFPALRRLAVHNEAQADEIAELLSVSPLMSRLRVLELGGVGDAGARALLASPWVRRLDKLDLGGNLVSVALEDALDALPNAVGVHDKGERFSLEPGDLSLLCWEHRLRGIDAWPMLRGGRSLRRRSILDDRRPQGAPWCDEPSWPEPDGAHASDARPQRSPQEDELPLAEPMLPDVDEELALEALFDDDWF